MNITSLSSGRASAVCSPKAKWLRFTTATMGFTLLELLVVAGIVSLLAALSLPALNQAKANAKAAICKNNLKQIGIGLSTYVDESSVYPHGTSLYGNVDWFGLLLPSCGNDMKLFRCPSDRAKSEGNFSSYGYNHRGTGFSQDEHPNLGLNGDQFIPDPDASAEVLAKANRALPESRVRVPSDMIAIGHFVPFIISGFGWPGLYEPRNSQYRRHSLELGLFCDGHIESSNPELIPTIPNAAFGAVFKRDTAYAQRWNNDNQPHPETWSSSMKGIWGE